MASGSGAPAYRFCDLQGPDILPIIGVPTIPPPHRSTYENEVLAEDITAPSAGSLDAVIKMLNEADVSNLRPLSTPKLKPDDSTPLISAVQAKNPQIFSFNRAAEPVQKPNKRTFKRSAAELAPPVSPAPSAQPTPPGPTPNTSSADRAKRPRTSLKLSIAATEKPTFAPTQAEEAAAVAQALTAALEKFSKRHAGLISHDENGNDAMEEDTEVEDEEDKTDGSVSDSHRLLLDIQHLGDATVRASGMPAVMQTISRDVLSRALRVLRAATERGRHTLLEVGDEENIPHVAAALAALEAAVVALRLSLGASATEGHVVSEEVLDAAVDAARFQLQHNILPFHDARLRAATRPNLGRAGSPEGSDGAEEDQDDDGPGPSKPPPSATKGKGKGKGRAGGAGKGAATGKVGIEIPSALHSVTDRVQAVLSLLCQLLPTIKVPTSMLVPLLRSSVAAITVPSLSNLHIKVAALMSTVFCSHMDLRKTILDDLFTHAVPYLGTSAKSLKREFPLTDSPSTATGVTSIQIFTAAVLQMVQGSAELPAADASPSDVVAAFGPSVKAADYFWTQCLDRLQTARSHKAETDHDFTAVLQGVVTDLLAAASLPEWPAAGTLVLRLAATINSQRGLQHTDPVVRQSCVDLLGRLLAAVHATAAAVKEESESAWLDGVALDNGYEDATQAAQELLLKYLADRNHSVSPTAAVARRFWLVRALSEGTAAAIGSQIDEESTNDEHVRETLVETRKKAEELDAMVYDIGIDAKDAYRLMRQALHAAFSRAAPAMLSWLLEMLDPRAQAPTTRAKAVKALADLASADSAVLGMPIVQAAVERSLQDDSISVREASLTLLGRHMVGDPELAFSLLNTVIKAVEDPGPSVKKAAIKILKDAAISVPGFPRATDACCALLPRASDSEESVQNAVAKVFHSLWFSPQVELAEGGTIKRSLEDRAKQLADVAAAAYEAGGPTIHLPLDTQSPLVGVLRAALGWEARGDLLVEWKAGREVAEALLESILAEQHNQSDDADEDAIRPALLALHALAVTDADFCLPEKDPQKFLRALAPYLKAAPDSQYTNEIDRRSAAERMLCVLSIVESVLSQLDRLADSLGALAEVPGDLVNLINQHRYTQVVAAACKCLSALAQRSNTAATRLVQVAHVYYSWLQAPGQHSPANLPRFLFILGQLCRYGADIIDKAAAAAPGGNRVSLPSCLIAFSQYWKYNGPPVLKEQIQRCALEATGQVAIARPLTMVQAQSDARQMLDAALKKESSAGFKMAALSSLTELLQADAESLERRQKVQLAATTAPAAVVKKGGRGSAAKKKKIGRGKKGAAAVEAEDEDDGPRVTVVATENGEGDSLSQSSAVLQQHWDAVLVLAADSGGTSGNARAVADGIAIRRRVVSLMEVVLRDGLVGPWTAVPALVALCSDSTQDVAVRALRMLSDLSEKHPQYVDAGRLTAGLEQAYKLHCGGSDSQHQQQVIVRRRADQIAPPAALAALGQMYSRLVFPSRPRRNEFLRAVLRQFRSVLSTGVTGGGRNAAAKGPPLRLLAFVVAMAGALPLRKGEEALILIQEASGICASHADAVLVELNRLLGDEGDEDERSMAVDAAALAVPCRAAAALCMLYRLRARLERAYSISNERTAAFVAAGKRKTAEESTAISVDSTAPPLQLGDLDFIPAQVDVAKAQKLYRELESMHSGDDMVE